MGWNGGVGAASERLLAARVAAAAGEVACGYCKVVFLSKLDGIGAPPREWLAAGNKRNIAPVMTNT